MVNPIERSQWTLLDEHKALQAWIREQQAWWMQVRQFGIPRDGEMTARLTTLRQHLADHFAHEELVARDAKDAVLQSLFQNKCVRFVEDHEQFLARLDRLIAKAASGGGYNCLGDLETDLSDFIHDIDAHEAEELRLLEAATSTT